MDDEAKPIALILDPGESGTVGGMTVRNLGEAPAQLEVTGDGPVLRGKMMVSAEQAVTPALRIYRAVQAMYLEPASFSVAYKPFLDMVRDLVDEVPSTGMIMAEIGECMAAGDFRGALDQCFELLRYEALLEEQALGGQQTAAKGKKKKK